LEANSVAKHETAINPKHLPIYRIEQYLLSLPQVDMPVDHQFVNGLYARSITIPAGVMLTGAVHRDECFFVVRTGRILITTDDEPIEAKAGFMAASKAGSKRLGLALEDTTVTTFHANPQELREPDDLWDLITVPAPDNLLEMLELEVIE
jgi:hypothetical protein